MRWALRIAEGKGVGRAAAWLLLGLGILAWPVAAQPEPRLRWQDTVDVDGLEDFATAVLVQRNRALVMVRGRLRKKEGDRRRKHENLLIAHRPSDGKALWSVRYENDRPIALVPAGRRTVVALDDPSGLDVLNAKTGALLWSWDEDRPGGRLAPVARVTKDTLYTAAVLPGPDEPSGGRIRIQARKLASGRLLWESWEPWSGIEPALGIDDIVYDLVPAKAAVFAVGVLGLGAGENEERFVRAYAARSGEELWTTQLPLMRSAIRLGTNGDSVVLAGNLRGGPPDHRRPLVVSSLDQEAGVERWRFERGHTQRNRSYYPRNVLAKDDLTIVVGFWAESRTPFREAVFAYALNRDTGTLVWEREVDITVEEDTADLESAEISAGALLIAYRRGSEENVLALTPQRGRTLWEIASPHFLNAIATQARKRLFLAGFALTEETDYDGVLSAYKLPPR